MQDAESIWMPTEAHIGHQVDVDERAGGGAFRGGEREGGEEGKVALGIRDGSRSR